MRLAKPSSGVILLSILGLVVFAVLLSPAELEHASNYSTLSTAPEGTKLVYDLSRRLGWPSQRRDVSFDKDVAPAPVQALIAVSLGAREEHAILDHVRHGGALLLVGTGGGLADSLHIASSQAGLHIREDTRDCRATDIFDSIIQGGRPIAAIRYTQPPPPDTVAFGSLESSRGVQRVAVGFKLGAGRVVVVADPDFLTNDVVRVCSAQADVVYVRILQFLTTDLGRAPIAFDEFHHGSGVHGGSLSAIRGYLGSTPSGRMLGQIAIAGLLLLIAAAPRPLSPRDPLRVARRSPLEHADALAHAYAAVGATRTATARLLSGVRRRTRRGRAGTRDSDEQLLAAAAAAVPTAVPAAALVTRGLSDTIPARELTSVATALSTIEDALTSRPSTRKP